MCKRVSFLGKSKFYFLSLLMLFISFSLDLLKDPNFKDMKKHFCLLIQRIGKLPINHRQSVLLSV